MLGVDDPFVPAIGSETSPERASDRMVGGGESAQIPQGSEK